ncbi:hypothetical protein [Thermococcus stetteri]|uniref:hypothetical protein n=1 Tax=Thermococcus stetteri TaxID=49900 RepID=UPI001AE5BBBE|nr:hypothetical protein [Thermococcus stetteri]MBP1911451.1 hypothetical protein [Thermococcus stetteri]
MRRFLPFLLLSLVVVSAACIGSGGQGSTTHVESPTGSHSSQVSSSTATPETWNMALVWNLSSGTLPFMDLSPDGSLAAVIDWNNGILYLVKPSGESVSFRVWEGEDVKPTLSGVAIRDGVAYVLASYEGFAGVRKYSWNGSAGEERHGWAGSVADDIARSPSGNHLCYLVTTGATTQELYCDGVKTILENAGSYNMLDVSDTGLVAVGSGGEADSVLIFKNGTEVLTLQPDTHMVVVYGDRIIGQFDGKLRVLNAAGKVLAESEEYTLRWARLLIPSVRATKEYVLWTDEYEGTHVLTWNLTEVRSLPGYMRFANENFVVTLKDGTLHCYSLRDFHEVFSVKAPGDGLVRLSDDGKVMLVSDEYGSYWLYRATSEGG